MSGLLQRLAAQSMGKTNAIRPLSRSRYAAPLLPESTADLDQHTHILAARMQPDHEQFHLDQRNGGKGRTAAHSKPPANPHAESAIQPHAEIPLTSLESIVNHPAAESVTAVIRDSQFLSADRNFRDSVSVPVGEKTISKFSAEPEQIETNDAIGYLPATHTAHSVHHVHLTESDTALPLLPLTKPTRVAVRNTPGIMQKGHSDRFMQTNQSKERGEETTEVHVHIGRIEVRATVAATPARKTPAKPSTMSLDDYLKQRSGRPR